MAELILGLGTSHGPTMDTPPEQWQRLGEKDLDDPRFDYQALLRAAPPGLQAELTLEKKRDRYDAVQAASSALAKVIAQARPDVMVVVSNPHRVFADDNQPVFGVYRGESLPVIKRTGNRWETAGGRDRRTGAGGDPGTSVRGEPRDSLRGEPRDSVRGELVEPRPREVTQFPAHPELANHLIDSLVEDGFDVAISERLRPDMGLEHEYTIVYERYSPGGPIPMVPFILSRYLPNQATPARCYALGKALRRAIESWDQDQKVAIMGSGGLSHQILDQELDRKAIDAMQEKDVDALCSLPRDRLNRAPGTPETLNWVTVAGAMQDRPMTLIDYVPCYRSLAGTGHGVTFAYWSDSRP